MRPQTDDVSSWKPRQPLPPGLPIDCGGSVGRSSMACCRRAAFLVVRSSNSLMRYEPVLERDHLLRAAVVRALRSALSPSDGRGCSLWGVRAQRPIWNQARAVLRYDKNSRRLLLGFKHGDHTHSAAAFGRWMHRAGSEVLAGADLLV